MNGVAIIFTILAIIIFWIVITFNGFIKKKNRVEEAWADIEVQLKRRYDLIPNLVETVKGYAIHEKNLLEDITKERTAFMNTSNAREKLDIDNTLTNTLKTLFAVSENYPELKANQNFLKLQDELTDTEDKIQAARRFYNANVRDYNISLEVFPANILAGAFGFRKKELFEIQEKNEKENIKINFN